MRIWVFIARLDNYDHVLDTLLSCIPEPVQLVFGGDSSRPVTQQDIWDNVPRATKVTSIGVSGSYYALGKPSDPSEKWLIYNGATKDVHVRIQVHVRWLNLLSALVEESSEYQLYLYKQIMAQQSSIEVAWFQFADTKDQIHFMWRYLLELLFTLVTGSIDPLAPALTNFARKIVTEMASKGHQWTDASELVPTNRELQLQQSCPGSVKGSRVCGQCGRKDTDPPMNIYGELSQAKHERKWYLAGDVKGFDAYKCVLCYQNPNRTHEHEIRLRAKREKQAAKREKQAIKS